MHERFAQGDLSYECPHGYSLDRNNCLPGEAFERMRALILEDKDPLETLSAFVHELFHTWRCAEFWMAHKCVCLAVVLALLQLLLRATFPRAVTPAGGMPTRSCLQRRRRGG